MKRTFKKASPEIRKLVVDAYLSGTESQTQLAKIFGYTPRTIRNWVREFRQDGRLTPRPSGHWPAILTKEDLLKLQALVEATPDMTLQEMREELKKNCSLSVISVALIKLGYTFKKNSTSQRTKQA